MSIISEMQDGMDTRATNDIQRRDNTKRDDMNAIPVQTFFAFNVGVSGAWVEGSSTGEWGAWTGTVRV